MRDEMKRQETKDRERGRKITEKYICRIQVQRDAMKRKPERIVLVSERCRHERQESKKGNWTNVIATAR